MHNTTKSNSRHRGYRNQGLFAPSFGNIINEILNSPLNEVTDKPKKYTYPPANVIKEENKYLLSIALPGVNKKDVAISIVKNKLTLKSDIEDVNTDIKYRLREFNYAKFERSFTLSDDADIDNISAKFEKGILTISIPTLKEAGPTEIKIK